MTTARAKFHADQAGLLALRKAAVRPVQGRTAPKRRKAASTAPVAMLPHESEAAFQRRVRKSLGQLGYIVWTFPIMKRTTAGVPDLTFWNPSRPGRLHMWELKTARGRVRPEQAAAIAHLSTVPGVDARIVRPTDWSELLEELIR